VGLERESGSGEGCKRGSVTIPRGGLGTEIFSVGSGNRKDNIAIPRGGLGTAPPRYHMGQVRDVTIPHSGFGTRRFEDGVYKR